MGGTISTYGDLPDNNSRWNWQTHSLETWQGSIQWAAFSKAYLLACSNAATTHLWNASWICRPNIGGRYGQWGTTGLSQEFTLHAL